MPANIDRTGAKAWIVPWPGPPAIRNSGSGPGAGRDGGHDGDRELDARALGVVGVLGDGQPAAARFGGCETVEVCDAAGLERDLRLRLERGGPQQRAEDESGDRARRANGCGQS